jgi:hypothetical protein
MKNFIYLATIFTTVISAFLPAGADAQSIFIQGLPASSATSTTIYIPSIETTTTIDRLNPNIDLNHNSVTNSTTTTYSGNSYPIFQHRQPQPTIILQQQTIYPRAVQSTCTTSIIGSPIPSPIALNSVTGQPCR